MYPVTLTLYQQDQNLFLSSCSFIFNAFLQILVINKGVFSNKVQAKDHTRMANIHLPSNHDKEIHYVPNIT